MKHVIFDIGGVLIDYDFERMAQALAERTGAEAEGLLPLFGKDTVVEVETGRAHPEEFFHRRIAPALPGMTYDDWVSAWMDNYSVNEPGWALLEELRDQGRAVSLLSNLSPYNQLAIERKFPDFFRATHRNFYSYELGLHKPDPDIYRAACAALEAEPAECVFLDDIAENVAGAREAGLHSLQFENDRIPEIREVLGLPDRGASSTAS